MDTGTEGGVPMLAFRTTSLMESSNVHDTLVLVVGADEDTGVALPLLKLLDRENIRGVDDSEMVSLLGLVKISPSDSEPEENSKGSGSRSAQARAMTASIESSILLSGTGNFFGEVSETFGFSTSIDKSDCLV